MDKMKIEFIRNIYDYLCNSFNNSFSSDVALFIACQFALESNFGTSRLAVSQYNFCGMKFPRVRITTAFGESSSTGFAMYSSLDSCIIDYVLCIQYHKPLRSDLENLNLFKSFIRFYCPDKDYITKISNIFNLLKNDKQK